MNNLISVIIPLFNRRKLIIETIDSILAQTMSSLEVIIIDDHSTDGSYDIVKNYVNKDSRFRVLKRKGSSRGAPECRNEGIMIARGKYLMFLDSDDLLDPTCIEQRLSYASQMPGKDYYIFNVALFSPDTMIADYLAANLETKDDLDGFIKYTGGWHTSSSLFKSEFVRKNLHFDTRALSWQDVEFHIRAIIISENYQKFKNSKPDVYVRISAISRISTSEWSYEKLYSRILIYSEIQDLILKRTGRNYKKEFLYFYFFYLEIAARKLQQESFSKIFKLWKSRYAYDVPKGTEVYLHSLNYLSRKPLNILGAILYKANRIFYGDSLRFPQKKVKLSQPIDLPNFNRVN
ncbi:glycosyltransferase family 2 protein [Autumnicola psychrophila]|uniref:Glycosyltransferase family 2 protein n=1 Tax=Autumnicola psychrophila TaxID=3075592 RepID=A0ABU3DUP1_9FLAO|nr:glycosyltransferase family 2 protein [Zunongwangia sp. F225]MDT0687443.1 glycosyltransferase family 2 protein [Zunongwangia sp. F225]